MFCKRSPVVKSSRKMWCPTRFYTRPSFVSNFYNDLPNCLDVATTTIYADDTTLTFSAINTASLKEQINNELKRLNQWLIANKLTLNVSKTEIMVITTRQKRTYINDTLNIKIDHRPVHQAKSVKMLGVQIEQTLSWSNHIEHIYKKVCPALGLLKRVRDYADHDTLINIYTVMPLSYHI